jgi:hypothetical protein
MFSSYINEFSCLIYTLKVEILISIMKWPN